MEEFDIDIVHRPGRRHGNVNGLTRAYEGVGDVSEDDDFPDATIMFINAEETPEEYQEIIQYLDGMKFLDGATKAVRTRITHKSRNYSMIGNQLYFQGRDGVLRRAIGKRDMSCLFMSFMMCSMEATLRDESLQKRFCRQVITGPPSSRMPMIITKVVMCVKLMHKGLL
jgi:hypothetical protein